MIKKQNNDKKNEVHRQDHTVMVNAKYQIDKIYHHLWGLGGKLKTYL